MKGKSVKSGKNLHLKDEHWLLKYSWLVVILISVTIYIPFVKNGFVYFDDNILVIENQKKIVDFANIGQAFFSDAFFNNSSPYYRPLLTVSLMFDAQFGKLNPGFYHFMNLGYHILVMLSLLWLLKILGFSAYLSACTVILFSIHPLLSNSVFWIPARNDLLVTLFGLQYIGWGLKWITKRNFLFLFYAVLALILALFSKESGILLPILLLAYLGLTRKIQMVREQILLFSGSFLLVLLWFLMRSHAITMLGYWQFGAHAIMFNLRFPIEIIAKVFVPFHLAVTPVYCDFYTIGGFIFAVLLFLTYFRIKNCKRELFWFGMIWFFLFMLPNMYVRLDTAPYSYDYLVHRAYFPLIGLIISIIALIPDNLPKSFKKPFNITILVIIIFFAGSTFIQGKKYMNAEVFWSSAIKSNPERAWFHYSLGCYYFKLGDYKKFEQYVRESLAITKHPRFLYNLGLIYFLEKKSYDSAFLLFNEALSAGIKDPEADSNFVKLCAESARQFFLKGNYKMAAERCKLAWNYDSNNAAIAYNLGLYYSYNGDLRRAAAMWRRCLILNSEITPAYKSLYQYYKMQNSGTDSANYFADQYRKRGGSI